MSRRRGARACVAAWLTASSGSAVVARAFSWAVRSSALVERARRQHEVLVANRADRLHALVEELRAVAPRRR
jgi:hypothetical protein